MAFKVLPSVLRASGRVVSQTLLRIVRSNFIAHEARIIDLDQNRNNVNVGLVLEFGGSSAPAGFLLCDGSEVSRETYADLFAVCGTRYGTPSSNLVFKLPDVRGRVLIGESSTLSVGDSGGSETHSLTADEVPSHSHGITDGGHSHDGVWRLSSGSGQPAHSSRVPAYSINYAVSTLSTKTATTGITLNAAGSGAAHNNMQPSAVVNYIIKT